MTALLFPGRHHLLTQFQFDTLKSVLGADPASLLDVNGRPLELESPIDTVLWAITSANHSNTRRNPLPANRREAAIERFAADLPVPSFVHLIDDIGRNDDFAEYVIKKIEVESGGRHAPTPDDTVVGCSTPDVIALYERLGFRVLPFELKDRATLTFGALTPWQVLQAVVKAVHEGRDWRSDDTWRTRAHAASRCLFERYDYGRLVADLHADPILTEDGDLTETRDYNAYVRSFDDGAARKHALVAELVVPGRIVDIGCCTGSLIRELTFDPRLRESDFYGIELARPLYAECLHRKEQGAFGNDNVFFHQRNIAAGRIFARNSVNTFTTFSLTHEIESYQGRAFLERFFILLRDQLASGGRWLNVDVVGPDAGDEPVILELTRTDGRNDDFDRVFKRTAELKAYLDGLSTAARFRRFATDHRRHEGHTVKWAGEVAGDADRITLSLRDACEFLSKKDYTDNWESEMHETFCFWSFEDWKRAVSAAGFRVHSASRAFVNPWIVAHRYAGKAALRRMSGEPMEFAPTNMVLAAEKP